MGDVVQLARARGRRERAARRRGAAPAFFYFDLACPFSYLAAERVERLFARVIWRPVLGDAVHRGDPWADPARAAAARAAAERRAAELRVPLVWPDAEAGGAGSAGGALGVPPFAPGGGRRARVARRPGGPGGGGGVGGGASAGAGAGGGGGGHAAGRRGWCGGFELDDPEVLAEAAAAAGLGLDDSLHAGGDVARDGPMEATARRLLAAGADRLPAVAVGRRLFAGELRLGEAGSPRPGPPRSAGPVVPPPGFPLRPRRGGFGGGGGPLPRRGPRTPPA